jgi:hypothetical protein
MFRLLEMSAAGLLREAALVLPTSGAGRWQCDPGKAGKIIRPGVQPSHARNRIAPDPHGRAEVKSAPTALIVAPNKEKVKSHFRVKTHPIASVLMPAPSCGFARQLARSDAAHRLARGGPST